MNTHLFYKEKDTWVLSKKNWPLRATALDVSHDPGLEYQLHQRVLPAAYRTSMQEWRVWRKVWEHEVTDDAEPVPFVQWLRAPGNLKRCREASRAL